MREKESGPDQVLILRMSLDSPLEFPSPDLARVTRLRDQCLLPGLRITQHGLGQEGTAGRWEGTSASCSGDSGASELW